MAQFSINLNVPDNNLAQALVGLQVNNPKLPGETNLVYVTRLAGDYFKAQVKEGLKVIAVANAANAVTDLGITAE